MARRRKTVEEQQSPNIKSEATSAIYAHGRRKEATARVRLFKNGGQIMVNQKPIQEYFPGEVAAKFYQKPFEVTNTLGQYSATIKVEGSGKSGQLGAVIHGLARALILANADFKPSLRKAGLVTRDPRAKERRKYGLAQKARKRKQSPKR